MSTLQRAIEIAVESHRGQVRKGGAPYILHPLRIMLKMGSDEARMAAVLHDVVEDTSVTADDLAREGFSADVLEAVRLLTHREDLSYEDYIHALAGNALATQVKLGDLEDNLTDQGPEPTAKDEQRLAKYRRVWKRLSGEAWPKNLSA